MSNGQEFNGARLRLAVLGVGAIGSTFAYHLARAGHDLTVIARPASQRLQQLQRDQAIVLKTGEKVEVRIAKTLEEEADYDLLVVTTLDHQVDALLPSLQRSKAKAVLFMFNTFEAERLQSAIGEARCAFGMPFVMSKLDGEGRLDAVVSSSRKTLHGDQRWVSLFNAAGVPSAYEARMPLWLRCQVPLCVSMESIAIKAQQRGNGASWAEAMVVARGLHGAFKIIEQLGYPVFPSAKKVLYGTPGLLIAGMLYLLSKNRPFREVLATGGSECRALVDVLLRAASGADAISPDTLASVRGLRPFP